MDIVYLNGQFIDKKDATISIMDRGFLFGDSIYEVVPAFHGKLMGGLLHFKRLQNSLKNIFIDCPFTDYKQFQSIACELLKKNKLDTKNCGLYFQITRGASHERRHHIPKNCQPTVVAFCMKVHPYSKHELENGFKAITHHDERHDRNFIKSTTLLTNIMLYEKALQNGAIEAILLRDGNVLECTQSNLFIVKNGIIKTPALCDTILAGVTRSLILQFAEEHAIKTQQTHISEQELSDADEIWITGSLKEICPIVTLNDKPVGDGKVGPMWHKINDFYQHLKETL